MNKVEIQREEGSAGLQKRGLSTTADLKGKLGWDSHWLTSQHGKDV